MNIKEIARRANVSSATVSRVINNSGYVKAETKTKVLSVIEENKYVPNAIARCLSIQDSLSIGVIIPDIENEFFSKVISGISEIAESFNYNIVFCGTNETIEKEHIFLKSVEGQRLKGVIITPISEIDTITKELLLHLEDAGIPVVLVDRDIRGEQFDGVFVDNQKGAYDGVEALIKAGHSKIAIISGPETSKPGRDRYLGYMQAMQDNGLKVPEDYIACGDFKIAKAYECAKKLLDLKKPPTAIFTSNNLSTLGCLKYFTEHKLKVGRDIAILGFDDIEALQIVEYKVSVVDRDAKEQGREAMRLLQGCFDTGNEGRIRGKKLTIPYNVILRGSERFKLG